MAELQVQGPGADSSVHLVPQPDPASPGPTVSDLLNEAPASKFHRRAVLISGMGFFTDAYDLFVIATVATLVKTQWNLSTTQVSWVTGSAILGAFFGAVIFGRIADVVGRKSIYVLVAVIMIIGAVASALAPGFWFLVIARFVLGLGIGGDYPVSAVLMSEYANRKDRGRLVGLVFSMQAVGLIIGPLVALVLLSSGIGENMTWRSESDKGSSNSTPISQRLSGSAVQCLTMASFVLSQFRSAWNCKPTTEPTEIACVQIRPIPKACEL